jgi:hypothetical protein
MKKQIGNINKFSFAEMTSNNDGKTSASGTIGILVCVVGTICFLIGCLDKVFINKDIDIITQSIIFVGIGASLLGLRKYKATDFVGVNTQVEELKVTTPPQISAAESGIPDHPLNS